MTPFLFLLTCLAAFRISRFVTHDTVPFGPLRDRLLNRWNNTIYAEGLTCDWCMGAWISAALVGALAQIRDVPLPGLQALAVSSVVGILAHYVED